MLPMPSKSKARPPAPAAVGYAAWKAHVSDMLQQANVPTGTLRERDLHKMFISGATPEKAAEQAGVIAHNTRPTFGRQQRRR